MTKITDKYFYTKIWEDGFPFDQGGYRITLYELNKYFFGLIKCYKKIDNCTSMDKLHWKILELTGRIIIVE
jgi:hypothetical protein